MQVSSKCSLLKVLRGHCLQALGVPFTEQVVPFAPGSLPPPAAAAASLTAPAAARPCRLLRVTGFEALTDLDSPSRLQAGSSGSSADASAAANGPAASVSVTAAHAGSSPGLVLLPVEAEDGCSWQAVLCSGYLSRLHD